MPSWKAGATAPSTATFTVSSWSLRKTSRSLMRRSAPAGVAITVISNASATARSEHAQVPAAIREHAIIAPRPRQDGQAGQLTAIEERSSLRRGATSVGRLKAISGPLAPGEIEHGHGYAGARRT